ncbi:MAG: hypothetical protein M3M94_05510 [Actinomycetota bacterium]|nr:hypothetical protein [Actinomycetota bacterium]
MAAAFGVLIALAMFALGLPRVLVPDGLGALEGERRLAAQRALRDAEIGCMDSPIGRAMTLSTRISVRRPDSEPPVPTSASHYEVSIRTYTFFGLPFQDISVRNGRIDCEA